MAEMSKKEQILAKLSMLSSRCCAKNIAASQECYVASEEW